MKNIIFFLTLLLSNTASIAETVAIVVTIKPLHGIVAAVTRKTADELYLVVNKAHSPHHYRMTPTDARKIKRADVVFAVDEMLETFLANARSDARLIFMTAEELPFLRTHAENKRDEHRHEGVDTHVWLNPLNGARMAQIVADVLSDIAPTNAKIYQRNAAAFKERLTTVDGEIALQLAPFSKRAFLTYHDAYGYFVAHYGLSEQGALSSSGVIRSRHFWQLKQSIATKNIVCIMTEPQFLSDAILRLADDSSIKVGHLDPLGADIPSGDDFYPRLLRKMAESLVDCLAAE